MIWLTWRQHRRQFLFAVLALGALAALLVPVGRQMHKAFADTGAAGCLRGLGTADMVDMQQGFICDRAISKFADAWGAMQFPAALLVLVPLLIGMFFGAPLISREVEFGTHRLVWTQGVTRGRWAAVKVTMLVAGSLALAAGYALLTAWWLGPIAAVDRGGARFAFPQFDLIGVAPVAHTLFALAVGVLAGAVSRRVMSAMAVTVFAYAAVRLAVTVLVRPNWREPETLRFSVIGDKVPNEARGDWILSDGVYEASGRLIEKNARMLCPPSEVDICGDDGRYNMITYQPWDRFWLFQWLESGLYVALAAILLGIAVWLVRRRA